MLTKLALCLLVICGAILALVFWMADPLYVTAPKDWELITVFHDHRAAFEKLRHMAVEDKDATAYISEHEFAGRLSDTRWQEYKRLLSEIRSGLVLMTGPQSARDPQVSVEFIFSRGGLGRQWQKGIKYVPGSAARAGVLVGTLDEPASLAKDESFAREIEPHWFLIFESYEG